MKRLSVLLVCMSMLLPLTAVAQNKQKGAHIAFESTECDLGEVWRKGENRSCTFRFVNDGTEPLVIFSAITSCSCLKADFSRKPVAVGERGEIRLVLESKKMDEGVFHRIVQIRSNSNDGTKIITIKGVSKE